MSTSFSPLSTGRNPRKGNRAQLSGTARLIAISKTLVYLCRHGAENHGLSLDKMGFVKFEELYNLDRTLREMKANEADVISIVDDQKADKIRPDVKWGNTMLFLRTYSGHGASSSVRIGNDTTSKLLTNPSFMIHSAGSKDLANILSGGLRRMQRNATHLIPGEFNARQSLYIQRGKTPFAVMVDSQAAPDQGMKFYLAENEIVVCDGGPEGVIDKRFFGEFVRL